VIPLTASQREVLRQALADRLRVVCFGAGVDSTAMLVILREAQLEPDLVTFADTGCEKPQTYEHLARMNAVLRAWAWPEVTVVRKVPLPETGYTDLYGNCVSNQTLPSLAFGLKACSIKWKQQPQDQLLRGVKSGPNRCEPHPLWQRAQATGSRIVKLIGYDCGRADARRAAKATPADSDFDYAYPLRLLGMTRADCVRVITQVLGPELVPIKSACYFCPASKLWELYWLAAHCPDLLERALYMERRALTGRHSRFDIVEFGADWETLVRSAERFPSSATTVGLGRNFAWNHWAVRNDVVDAEFRVHRDAGNRERFLTLSTPPLDGDNALDRRAPNLGSPPTSTAAVRAA
jgi:hypothetical protein